MNSDAHRWIIVFLNLCASVFIFGSSAAAAAPRNVLLIIADDMGLDGKCFGNDAVKTPNLDALAAESTNFANAFATVASCSPSRAVILSGRYTHSNGQYGLAHAEHNQVTRKHVQTLPNLLKAAGYRTAIIGKHHVNPDSVYSYETFLKTGGEGNRSVATMARRAGQYMAADDKRPFFLVVGFSDPHRAGVGFDNDREYPGVTRRKYDPATVKVPAHLPDDPAVRRDIVGYYEAIDRLDQGVGMLMEHVEKAGRREDTLVIFASDNGMPFPGAKTNLYDAGVHLPLIVRAPGRQGGVVSQAMVSWIDLAPTVLEFAGAKSPDDLPGRSLLGIIEQEKPAGWDAIFASHVFHEITMYYPMRAVRTRTHKLIWNVAHPLEFPIAEDIERSPSWRVMQKLKTTSGGKSLEAFQQRPEFELYDMEKDPQEMKNLADDPAYAEVRKQLHSQLTARLKETNDPWLAAHQRREQRAGR
jgi:N-sulfoglucosamine sulfohydrolase